MGLTIYGFHNDSKLFAVTKIGEPIESCPFFLDFSRPIERTRWFGVRNKWIGPVVFIGVPIIHQSEQDGGFVILLTRSEPYFFDVISLWKMHFGSPRLATKGSSDSLQVAADFGMHFPDGF